MAPSEEAPAADAEEPETVGASHPLDADRATTGASKKKPNKKKKSGPGAGGADNDDDAREGEGENEDAEDGAATGGKKKNKKKKKKNKSGQTVALSDEAFQKWVEETLAATKNESEQGTREELSKPDRAFLGYSFSGSLRPWKVTPQVKMPESIQKPDYANEPDGRSEIERVGLREVPVLEGEQLATMKEVCRLGREVLDIASRFLKAGVTGDQIDRIVYQACVERQLYPSPLNYNGFPKTVCVSANEVICHGIPDCRPIEEGDIINLDVSVFYKGLHTDLNETFLIGQCDEDSHRLVRTAYKSLHAAAKLIRPGTFYRDVGNDIHLEAVKNGCSVVNTYCGHGVGELFHGPPRIPHYRKNKAVGIMKPGHVFTIEPMLNLGGNGGDRTWPDDWTAVTPTGARSAQFEHTFLVTQDGFEVLTARPGTDRFSMPEYDPIMFQR
eukprot:CAMPEP_0206615826 /NCGR_PEP_ID=MMETSP0325_2-20121206/58543_1 /ASSEMBLY_ACC=CAM_ASM_000347 /TAXON_ID=2866 /ORGANISM="Crypthecodinium cohnii, Strain Seligo" /LENGTH=441 /DNA_ID=CAMNT_0054137237 /DNA_START=68 /DNA_END=1393 /DNA_ORIENTATION=+